MEEYPGISNKGSVTPLRSSKGKGRRQLPEPVVIAARPPSCSCGFMERTPAAGKLTVNRGQRPREGIFSLLPSPQLMPPFCRNQLGARGQESQDDVFYGYRSASQVSAVQKGQRVDLAGPMGNIQDNTEILIFKTFETS